MAGKFKFQKNKKNNPSIILGLEKKLITKNYSMLDCKIKKGVLNCYGFCQPTSTSANYKFRITYNAKTSPSVYVSHPEIEYNDDIHMFPQDNSLCLYHKTDLIWNSSCHLFDTIIPWTYEWFLFYEIYLITGEWEHPFVKHKRIKEK